MAGKSGYPDVLWQIEARRLQFRDARYMYFAYVVGCAVAGMFVLIMLFAGQFTGFVVLSVIFGLAIWLTRRYLSPTVSRLRFEYSLRCPHCSGSIQIGMPWTCVCGMDHPRTTANPEDGLRSILAREYDHFLNSCAKCSRTPNAIACPHCSGVILTTPAAIGWDEELVLQNCAQVGLESMSGYSPHRASRDPAAEIRSHLDGKA